MMIRSVIRIGVVAWKEWVQLLRDARSLTLALIIPAFMILLFGYALNVDIRDVPFVVYDMDRTSGSRDFIGNFTHNGYLHLYTYADSYGQIDRLINAGKIRLGVVIPPHFSGDIKSGKSISVQLISDGSDSTSSIVATGYVKAITMMYNMEYRRKYLGLAGLDKIRAPVTVESRVLYNPELKSKNFIIPGLIVLILAIISSLITSLTISREWERGTMETLVTTPLRSFELVTGKLVPYLFVGMIDVVICVGVGYLLFGIPFRGNFLELYLVALLFLTGTCGLGILLSGATRSQVLSVQMAMVVTYLPSFILSGFMFPISNMPVLLQLVTRAIPARYMIVLLKGIILKGISVTLLWSQIVFLAIFALTVIVLCVKSVKMKLPE